MATPLMSLPDQSPGKAKYVVPWKSRKEFLKVYHDLYSEDESLQLAAVNRITTWKSRAGSKLSVAVENTGVLFKSILSHRSALREQQVNEMENILRSSYGLAVVRFVNFVTEKGQTKQTAQPVHSLAREFGIPEWIVRIRHDVTHNVIPSLDMLATAASWAVQYLKEEFWDCQNHESADVVDKCRLNTDRKIVRKIRHSLETYSILRSKEIRTKELNQSETTDELTKLKEHLKQNRFSFMKCVLEDGCFIPSEDQLESFQLSTRDILNQSSPRIPNQVVEFWHPILALLCTSKAISTFTKIAMFSLTNEDCLRNHFIAGWLDFLLHKASVEGPWRKVKSRRSRSKKLVFGDALLHKKVLLSVCLENVNKFTIHLLKYLLDKEELGDDAYLQMVKLLHYTPESIEEIEKNSMDEEEEDEIEEDGTKDNVYTAEDLKEEIVPSDEEESPPPVLERVQEGVQEEEIGWRVCTDIVDWSKIPFGTTPLYSAEDEEESENEEEMEDDNSYVEEEQLETHKQEKEGDNSNFDDDEGEDEEKRQTRDWKRTQRKRTSTEDLNSERSSSKRSTYVVNDTELL